MATEPQSKSIQDVEMVEDQKSERGDELPQHADRAVAILRDRRIELSDEENKRIRRKIDKRILPVLICVYFLQILDKSMLGYAAIFGMEKAAHLEGNQYSLLGSIAPIAQLAWQPFSSILIVKVPHRILMPTLVLGWGIASLAMAFCKTWGGLMATRFLIGLFEAGCLPLFGVITANWYRRGEQPIRIAAWYGTNGFGTIFAAIIAYGFGHVTTGSLEAWQIIFLFPGLLTIITVPWIWWTLDNDIASARFLTEQERLIALERLRDNQTGTGSRELKHDQIWECFYDPKVLIFLGMVLCNNAGAAVTNTFGPLVLKGLGYDIFITSLLNIPFGFLQWVMIMVALYATQKIRLKSPVLVIIMLPVVAGLAMLYVLKRGGNQAPLLVAYYLLSPLFGGNPLFASWIVANTGGMTKKSIVLSLYNGASAAGNIVGSILFASKDAPEFHPGLRRVLALFATLIALVGIQVVILKIMNKYQSRRRMANGKPAILKDYSMDKHIACQEERASARSNSMLGHNAFLDLSDMKNDEFVYVY
ncbi:hypothetical protein CLAIMM_14936 [Cladophialophora immunda]|nr:hypothetical protein CLAIMM_14936 [Cladophialophora immunda]